MFNFSYKSLTNIFKYYPASPPSSSDLNLISYEVSIVPDTCDNLPGPYPVTPCSSIWILGRSNVTRQNTLLEESKEPFIIHRSV